MMDEDTPVGEQGDEDGSDVCPDEVEERGEQVGEVSCYLF